MTARIVVECECAVLTFQGWYSYRENASVEHSENKSCPS